MEQSLKMGLLACVKRGDVGAETVGCMGGPEGLGSQILINGGTYCRAHLRPTCHMCEGGVTYTQLHDDANSEREAHGLRPVGDPGLDESSCVQMAVLPRCTACAYYKCAIEWTGTHASTGVELLTCTGCGIARYCSKECQRKDWRWEHKAECDWDGTLEKALAKAAPLRAATNQGQQ